MRKSEKMRKTEIMRKNEIMWCIRRGTYLFDNTPCAVKSLSKLSVLLCLEQGTDEQHLLIDYVEEEE